MQSGDSFLVQGRILTFSHKSMDSCVLYGDYEVHIFINALNHHHLRIPSNEIVGYFKDAEKLDINTKLDFDGSIVEKTFTNAITGEKICLSK